MTMREEITPNAIPRTTTRTFQQVAENKFSGTFKPESIYYFSIPLQHMKAQRYSHSNQTYATFSKEKIKYHHFSESLMWCAIHDDRLSVAYHASRLRRIAGKQGAEETTVWQYRDRVISDRTARSLAQRILEELESDGLAKRRCVDAWLTILGTHIVRTYSNPCHTSQRPQLSLQGLNARNAAKIARYISENINERLTIPTLAQQVGLSCSHFTRAFQMRFSISPHKYIIKRRLDRASQLAAYTILSFDTIARMAGFSNNSHMTATMRRELGVTPTEIRHGRMLPSRDDEADMQSICRFEKHEVSQPSEGNPPTAALETVFSSIAACRRVSASH